ncbi:MAG: hypothetical protein ACO1NW_17650 [Chitinophagaceae bacterium]
MFNPLQHEVLLKNQWHEIIYFGAVNLVRHNYFPYTRHMDPGNYRQIMREHAQILKDKQAAFILEDTRNFYFVINAELRSWLQDYMKEELKGMEILRTAIISGDDFFAQLSIEQLIPDELDRNVIKDLKYFENEEEALLWLTGPL